MEWCMSSILASASRRFTILVFVWNPYWSLPLARPLPVSVLVVLVVLVLESVSVYIRRNRSTLNFLYESIPLKNIHIHIQGWETHP